MQTVSIVSGNETDQFDDTYNFRIIHSGDCKVEPGISLGRTPCELEVGRPSLIWEKRSAVVVYSYVHRTK